MEDKTIMGFTVFFCDQGSVVILAGVLPVC